MNPDKRVRRVQSLLYTNGVGVILFSIWTGLRGIESLFEIDQKTIVNFYDCFFAYFRI